MITILYVDDEQALLEIGKLFLEKSGKFRVDCATTVKKALEILEKKPYDAIVSDYQMPEQDGIEFLKIVRAAYPTLPFIIFTGKGREEIVIEAFNSGADFYVQKGGAPQAQFVDLEHKISVAVESRKKDRALTRSEEKYRNLVERANAGIIVLQDGKVRYRNQFFARLLGYPLEEMQGRSPCDFIDPVDVPRVKDYYARRFAGEQLPGIYEVALVKKDGSRVPVELNAGMVMFEDAPADLILVQDITDRKQMEAELKKKEDALHSAYREITRTVEELRKKYDEQKEQSTRLRASEEKYRDLYDNAPIATYSVDRTGRIIRGNQQAATLFGVPKDALPGRFIFDFYADTPEGSETTKRRFERFWSGESIKNEEFPLQRADGSRVWISLTVGAVRNEAGEIIESRSMAVDITETKRLNEERMQYYERLHQEEAAARRNKEKFRTIFDTAANLIASVNRQGIIVDCNQRVFAVLGYEKAEIIGRPIAHVIHPDHHSQIDAIFAGILQTGTFTNDCFRMVKKDRTVIDVSINATGIKDRKGDFFRVVCILDDITERRQKDYALRENRAFLKDVLDSIQDGISILDRDQRVILVNKTMEQWYAHKMPLIGRYCYETYHDSREPCMVCPTRQVLQTGTAAHEIVPLSRDGKTVGWLNMFAFPLKDQRTGEITGVIECVRDVTGQKTAEDALRQSEARFRNLIETFPGTIWELDPAGNFSYLSPMSARSIGYSPEQLLGKSMFSLVPEKDQPAVRAAFTARIEGKDVSPFIEVPVTASNGQKKIVEIRPAPLLDGDGHTRGLCGIALDITERKEMENALRENEFLLESFFNSPGIKKGIVAIVGDDILHIADNEASAAFYGQTRESMRNTYATDLGVPTKIIQEWIRQCEKSRMTNRPVQFEYEHTTGSSSLWFSPTVNYLGLARDGRHRFSYVVYEITERKKMERALVESEARFRALFDHMIEGHALHELIYDKNGKAVEYRILEVNKAYETLMGLSRGTTIGRLSRNVYGGDTPRFFDIYARVARTGKAESFEWYYAPQNKHFAVSVYSPAKGQFALVFEDITSRKRIKEALENERNQLERITSTSPVGIVVIDRTGVITYANRRAEQILNLIRDETGQRAYRAPEWRITTCDGQPFRDADLPLSRIKATGLPVTGIEHAIEYKDHRRVMLSVNATPVLDADHHVEGIVASIEDITGRKKMEAAIREREEQLALALEGSGACLWDWQVQTGEIVFTERWVEILGYTLEELAPLSLDTWVHRIHPEDYLKSEALIQKHFNGETPRYECEVRLRHKEGHWIWLLDRGMVTQRDDENRPVRMTGTHLDITDRKRMEEALIRSEEQYRLLTDRMNDILWILDPTLHTTYVSPSIETILGFTTEERMRQEVIEQLTPDSLAVVHGILESELAKEHDEGVDPDRTVKIELEYFHKNGTTRWLENVISIIRNKEGTLSGFQGVSRDITERRQTDKALRQAHKQLNLLTSITRHDILNQILALNGYLELSGIYINDPVRLTDFLEKEKAATAAIESHIALTREYEEMGVKEPVWQNIHLIIGQMCSILPLRQIHVESCCEGYEVFADPLFERVIYNLIDNALRYGGDKMTVIRFSIHESDGNLVLTCENDGEGIPYEEKKYLFRRGFGKHTGLGLFLSCEILTITGMTIRENGEPGSGARFEIMVPTGHFRTRMTGLPSEGRGE